MAFAIGNTLAKDHRPPKPFRDALMLVLKEAGTDLPRLRKVADALLKQAERGNIHAVREVADRIDGKVPQAIVDSEGGDIVLQVVRYVVEPAAQVIDVTAQTVIDAPLSPDNQSVDDAAISDT
jgi:hypothetical protein